MKSTKRDNSYNPVVDTHTGIVLSRFSSKNTRERPRARRAGGERAEGPRLRRAFKPACDRGRSARSCLSLGFGALPRPERSHQSQRLAHPPGALARGLSPPSRASRRPQYPARPPGADCRSVPGPSPPSRASTRTLKFSVASTPHQSPIDRSYNYRVGINQTGVHYRLGIDTSQHCGERAPRSAGNPVFRL